jgi:hypothetical protein
MGVARGKKQKSAVEAALFWESLEQDSVHARLSDLQQVVNPSGVVRGVITMMPFSLLFDGMAGF